MPWKWKRISKRHIAGTRKPQAKFTRGRNVASAFFMRKAWAYRQISSKPSNFTMRPHNRPPRCAGRPWHHACDRQRAPQRSQHDPQIRQNQIQIFDLKEPEHIDPSGMRLLIQANKRLQAQGRRTELRLPPDSPVYLILSLLQFERFVPYADQM